MACKAVLVACLLALALSAARAEEASEVGGAAAALGRQLGVPGQLHSRLLGCSTGGQPERRAPYRSLGVDERAANTHPPAVHGPPVQAEHRPGAGGAVPGHRGQVQAGVGGADGPAAGKQGPGAAAAVAVPALGCRRAVAGSLGPAAGAGAAFLPFSDAQLSCFVVSLLQTAKAEVGTLQAQLATAQKEAAEFRAAAQVGRLLCALSCAGAADLTCCSHRASIHLGQQLCLGQWFLQ